MTFATVAALHVDTVSSAGHGRRRCPAALSLTGRGDTRLRSLPEAGRRSLLHSHDRELRDTQVASERSQDARSAHAARALDGPVPGLVCTMAVVQQPFECVPTEQEA